MTFTDDELAKLRAAARRESLALAALIAKAAMDLVEMRGVPATDAFLGALKELMMAAELVRQTGDRLNRTGVSGLNHAAVARAEQLIYRLDDAALELRKKL